jgi:23S rRNA pseudouridine2605 synthase
VAERLQKIISAHGIASRRKAEELITQGRVTVNGVAAHLGDSADPETDEIAIDGAPIRQKDRPVYIALNKPKGYVTTMSDDRGRPTVAELVADVGVRVYPVGRLDMDSEGLLILTNDGDFANRAAHPGGETSKTYIVTVTGTDIPASAAKMTEPMDIDGYIISPAQVEVISVESGTGHLSVTIHEGRNRQVRKMCGKCGLSVKRLVRISEGGVKLGNIPVGKWRNLTDDEVRSI